MFKSSIVLCSTIVLSIVSTQGFARCPTKSCGNDSECGSNQVCDGSCCGPRSNSDFEGSILLSKDFCTKPLNELQKIKNKESNEGDETS